MNIKFIEDKMNEIIKELEMEVMEILMDETLDKKQTNLHTIRGTLKSRDLWQGKFFSRQQAAGN